MRRLILLMSLALLAMGQVQADVESELQQFIDQHVAILQPLSDQANLAYWDGATTGKPEAFAQRKAVELQISTLYTDTEAFARLQQWRQSGRVQAPLLKRQMDKLFFAYQKGQIPQDLMERMVSLDNKVQEAYTNYRPEVDGQVMTMSDIYTAMTTETDLAKREKVWRASKEVGNLIFDDLIELVKLRNQAARLAGYDNYHTMSVACSEQDVTQIDEILTQLIELTEQPFIDMKRLLDEVLARQYGIAIEALRPWHYHDPFFQRTPLVYELDLDTVYQDSDIEALMKRYYASVGLPINDILDRSDLYERAGKYPHAFSFEADREGDVRVLCNLQNTERWAETALHELGHAVYSKYHDRTEPWLLREPAHAFTTEAVAMFFGRLSRNPAWMQKMLNLSDERTQELAEVSGTYLRFQQILFARWAAVMYFFEKQLYADPDQDLNTLWWDMVERYQKVTRPEDKADAGWASKLHFATAPCYYHNYMLGELLASQFHHTIVHDVLKTTSDQTLSLSHDPRIGAYFKAKVFAPGARYHWNEMIERATGEPLNPKYFVEQFIQ